MVLIENLTVASFEALHVSSLLHTLLLLAGLASLDPVVGLRQLGVDGLRNIWVTRGKVCLQRL